MQQTEAESPESSEADIPIVDGKYPDGRFAPGNEIESPRHPKRHSSWSEGQSGNPAGRPVGSQNNATPWFTGELQQSDIDKLKTMRRDDLIALMTKLGGIIGLALKTEQEIDDMMRLKLAYSGLNEERVHVYLPAIREYYDRTKGKPSQSVNMNVNDDRMDKLPIEQLLRLAAMLDEPVVIAPLKSK